MPEVVGVKYLKGGGVYYFLTPKERLPLDSFCVVEGEHGLQIARVVRASHSIPSDRLPDNLRAIVRVASGRDHEQWKRNQKKEQDAYRLCRKKVQEKGLQMKLVDVSYTLDGRKAIFFFTAESRVDFRELVKELAQALKIKIEMRQIGVRDEARRLGGVGCCGRVLCCATFLKDFASVSIRMAKAQNLSLNPTKVSGLCGRLMCCLAYEYEGTAAKGKKKKGERKTSTEGNSLNKQASQASVHAGCAGECESACVSEIQAPKADSATLNEKSVKPGLSALPDGQSNDMQKFAKSRPRFRRSRGQHNHKKSNRRHH